MIPRGEFDGFALTREAPAKINLALHVVGQRADGHHLLESLVTFADAGDRIGMSSSGDDRFTVSGRFSGDMPLDGGNLVLRARDLLRAHSVSAGAAAGPVHLHLEKNLPVASGIGGGSADAAAVLSGLMMLWRADVGPAALRHLALTLGADVPMCLDSQPLLARGIGEDITLLSGFPAFPMLLVNPLVAVSTPMIFRTLVNKANPPLVVPSAKTTAAGWIAALCGLRNDLEPPARGVEPAIGAVAQAIAATNARLVRMSGSGATCFGLYETAAERDAAFATLSHGHPDWYCLACSSVAARGDEHGRD